MTDAAITTAATLRTAQEEPPAPVAAGPAGAWWTNKRPNRDSRGSRWLALLTRSSKVPSVMYHIQTNPEPTQAPDTVYFGK